LAKILYMNINISTPTSLKGLVEALLVSAALLLLIASKQAAAQAPVGVVDPSGGGRGQGVNSSLQQLQEMDAVRREMSELRNLIERHGYEFNQYKRKSDQEILVLREQLRSIQGGANDGEFNRTDGGDSGFTLGDSDNAADFDTPPLANSKYQSVPEVPVIIDEEPGVAMIGVSMGRYGQPATAALAITGSTIPALTTLPVGPQDVSGSGFNDVSGSYQQARTSNVIVVVPDARQAIVTPITVEVVPVGGAVIANQPQVSQSTTSNEILTTSGAWQRQNYSDSQSGPLGSNTSGAAPTPNQQPDQNNYSELQWQVIRSSGSSSVPLDDPVTGSQVEQSGGNQADSFPSQTESPADSVLGDI
jgi:hypothetical protein